MCIIEIFMWLIERMKRNVLTKLQNDRCCALGYRILYMHGMHNAQCVTLVLKVTSHGNIRALLL